MPPLISVLTVDYTVTTTPTPPDAVVSFNNAQFDDLRSALAAERAAPFVPLPSQQSALYAAFTLPPARTSFPNRTISLYHGVRQPPFGEIPAPVSPELSVQSGVAGSTTEHHFTFTNTGSDPVDCDVATLGGAWTSTVPVTQRHFPLLPGLPTKVPVSVVVPSSLAGSNASDRGFLTVRLSSDSAVHTVGFETRIGKVAPPRRELQLEYWNGTAWTALVAADGTDQLEHPGIVEFLGPADFTPSQLFGVTAYWMRSIFEPGDAPPVQLRRCFRIRRSQRIPDVATEVLGRAMPNPRHSPRAHTGARRPVLECVRMAKYGWAGSKSRLSRVRRRSPPCSIITGEVRFGDGVQGQSPRGIGNIRGAPDRWRRPRNAFRHDHQLQNSVASIDTVTNVEPAEGGLAPVECGDVACATSTASRRPRRCARRL